MQVPIPITFEPHPETLSADIAAIPGCQGIFSLATAGNAPHIGRSINLRRRLTRLLVPSYTADAGELSAIAAKTVSVSYWVVASKLEGWLISYELSRKAYPESYLKRLHLRMPWFVGLAQTTSFARLETTNRLPRPVGGLRLGPFRSKETAQLYEEQVQGLHQLRRCTEVLAPSPEHPGCIYGEMNQCLRPCQQAVSPEEYGTETERVAEFLATAGQSALRYLTASRDRAVAELDFEQAAQVHKRIEKVQAASSARDKVVGPAEQFHGVALTRASGPDAVHIWPLFAGYWQSPIRLYLPPNEGRETRPLDSLLRERLQQAVSEASTEGNRLEHMALFSRWYYSSWRDGEWFGFVDLSQLSYRKLVRAISELVKAAP